MYEFCQYKLFREPKPPLFIPPPYAKESESNGHIPRKRVPTLHLRASDPSKLLLLTESLKDECTPELELKINSYLMEEAQCDYAFMACCLKLPNDAVIQLIGNQLLQDEILVPCHDKTFLDIIANKTGKLFACEKLPPLIVNQIRARIAPDIEANVMAFPIFSQKHRHGITMQTDTLSYLVFLVNSTLRSSMLYHLVNECFRFVLPILTNTTTFEREKVIRKRMQQLLYTGIKLFNATNDKNALIALIGQKGKQIFTSERCDIYFADTEELTLHGKIYCNGEEVIDEVSKDYGIIGYVFSTKTLLNIENAYSNPLFLKRIDEKCNFQTRNILCFPILSNQNAIGCIQVCNKFSGNFNIFDEKTSFYFAEFVQQSVQYANVLKKVKEEREKFAIATKFVLYSYDYGDNDVQRLVNGVPDQFDDFETPMFNARNIPEDSMGIMIMSMFDNLHFIQMFKIDRKILAKFLVVVQKGYANRPYHSWIHAFVATHFIYATIVYLKLIERNILSNLEAMALIISAICYNLDHKVIPNIFRATQDSTLANVYLSNRTLSESYHFLQTINVLHTKGCNFLENLSVLYFCLCIDFIKHNIVSMSFYEKLRLPKKQEILLDNGFRPKSREAKYLFCSLLITCAALCDHTMDWRTERFVAQAMYEAYFHEGELDEQSTEVFNKLLVPTLFIDFLKEICELPFRLLSLMYADMTNCVQGIYINIERWETAKIQFNNRDPTKVTSLDLLRSSRLNSNAMLEMECAYEEEMSQDDSVYM